MKKQKGFHKNAKPVFSFLNTRFFLLQKKKNCGQVQFNWIFVLIAGAIFLAFFITIAFKYKALQEEKTNIEILNKLDIAITSLQSSPFKTTTKMNLPLETEFLCNPLAIKIGKRQHPTNNIIAAQGKIKGPAIITSSQLNLPFKIATIYSIIPESKQYVFVYDDSSQEKIQEIRQDLSLIENIQYEKPPIREEQDKTYIYFAAAGKNKVQVNEKTIQYPGKQPQPYYSNSHLYALIFSSQPECINNLILQEITLKSQLYINKVALLQSKDCSYALLSNKISQLSTNPSKDNQELVRELNKQLINQDCPAVF